jgi:acyl-[acyl-carrier-protein] desaturase
MQRPQLIPSLEPKLRDLYAKHLDNAIKVDWAYSDFLPLQEWRTNQDLIPRLSPSILSAVELAVFTEVNLPWFTTFLSSIFKGTWGVLEDFVHTWTSEEDAHSVLLETYLLLGNNGDPRARAKLRKQIIRVGLTATLENEVQALVYTSIQERATQVYYLLLAQHAEKEDPGLAKVLRRLAKDESLHYSFYRDAVKAHIDVDPNWVYTVADVMLRFEMPGRGSPGYQERADAAALADIYGPEQFFTQVIDVLLRYWNIESLHPTYQEAREAQLKIVNHQKRLARIAARMAEKREQRRLAAAGD